MDSTRIESVLRKYQNTDDKARLTYTSVQLPPMTINNLMKIRPNSKNLINFQTTENRINPDHPERQQKSHYIEKD